MTYMSMIQGRKNHLNIFFGSLFIQGRKMMPTIAHRYDLSLDLRFL